MPGIRHRASLPIAVIPDGGYREIHLKLVRMDPRRLLVGMKEGSCYARYSSLGISPLRSFPTFSIGNLSWFPFGWISATCWRGLRKREKYINPCDQPAGMLPWYLQFMQPRALTVGFSHQAYLDNFSFLEDCVPSTMCLALGYDP